MPMYDFEIINESYYFQDGICDKSSAPSVSSISRLLRGSRGGTCSDDGGSSVDGQSIDLHRPQHDHTINGILASK